MDRSLEYILDMASTWFKSLIQYAIQSWVDLWEWWETLYDIDEAYWTDYGWELKRIKEKLELHFSEIKKQKEIIYENMSEEEILLADALD